MGRMATKRKKRSAPKKYRKASALEERFIWTWMAVGGPTLVREYVFAPPRKFRFDFADLNSRIAIEIDGGIFMGGRHTRGKGYENDCIKNLLAVENGWTVIHLTASMINAENIQVIIGLIRDREQKCA